MLAADTSIHGSIYIGARPNTVWAAKEAGLACLSWLPGVKCDQRPVAGSFPALAQTRVAQRSCITLTVSHVDSPEAPAGREEPTPLGGWLPSLQIATRGRPNFIHQRCRVRHLIRSSSPAGAAQRFQQHLWLRCMPGRRCCKLRLLNALSVVPSIT
jgi:hypothetical protein